LSTTFPSSFGFENLTSSSRAFVHLRIGGVFLPVLAMHLGKAPVPYDERFPAFFSSAVFVELKNPGITVSPSMIIIEEEQVPLESKVR
jgi:hypothetical protein